MRSLFKKDKSISNTGEESSNKIIVDGNERNSSYQSSKFFTKCRSVIIVVAIAIVGSVVLVISHAAPNTTLLILPASQMTLPAGASLIANTGSSTPAQVAKLTESNTSLTSTVVAPPTATTLTVTAAGVDCSGGWPTMSVTLGSYKIFTNASVNSTNWMSFTVTGNAAGGTYAYTITDTSANACRTLYVEESVWSGPTTTTPAPTVSLSASPTSVTSGSASTLTWSSTNATSCTESGAASGTEATSGSASTGALTSTSTYTMTCTGSGGTGSASVSVTVNPANSNPSITWGIVDTQIGSETAAQMASDFANLKTLGVTSVRLEANQEWVQYGGSTSYNWSQIDSWVDAVHTAGMSCEMDIDGSASWDATDGVSTGNGQPLTSADFAAWANAVVQRYENDCNTYEIWNEPNSVAFWTPAPNAAAYTQDLIAAYTAIKSVDPSATVLTGGLAPESNDGTNVNEVTFLQDIYADGGKGYFNAVADHPYSYPDLPNTYAAWSGWSQLDSTSPSIRSVMVSNGDSAKQIWITEVGAPTGGPSGIGNTDQAEEFTQAIADAKSMGFIGGFYIYSSQDSGTDTTNSQDWFGLQTYAGVQKPSWAAVQAAIQ